MVQELISNKTIAIIGAGPAGCVCAKYLIDYGYEVTLFDYSKPLRTILPTGGGRCNLASAIYEFRELAKNYPRGEKFLYSVFSKFSTKDTIELFKTLGINTYTQEDNRIFPTSNSSEEVKDKILKSIKNANIIEEKVISLNKLDNGYKISTNKSKYLFDYVVIAIGGHSKFEILKNLDINIVEPTQALVGLKTKDNFAEIAGVSLKNIKIKYDKKKYIYGDLLFTHKGISGPVIYKLSSILARKEFPYNISISFVENLDLQKLLNENSKKEIKNLLAQYLPKSLVVFLLKKLEIDGTTLCHKITSKIRDTIIETIENFQIEVTNKVPDNEVVTCGGIDLKEIDSKTMQFKNYPKLYACGEVLDIDGFCGGFNLQNCWSTAYVVASSINKQIID